MAALGRENDLENAQGGYAGLPRSPTVAAPCLCPTACDPPGGSVLLKTNAKPQFDRAVTELLVVLASLIGVILLVFSPL